MLFCPSRALLAHVPPQILITNLCSLLHDRLMREDLWDTVTASRLRLPIDRTYRLDQAADALTHMHANAHFGKIVMTV